MTRWVLVLLVALMTGPALAKKKRRVKKKPPAPPVEQPKEAAPVKAERAGTLRRSTRIEFDARLVRGEKASGAVYLFQRSPRRFPPLVSTRRSWLDRIVRPVLLRDADPPEEKTEE